MQTHRLFNVNITHEVENMDVAAAKCSLAKYIVLFGSVRPQIAGFSWIPLDAFFYRRRVACRKYASISDVRFLMSGGHRSVTWPLLKRERSETCRMSWSKMEAMLKRRRYSTPQGIGLIDCTFRCILGVSFSPDTTRGHLLSTGRGWLCK